MNVIKTSFFYKTIKYVNEIHEHSFIYKTRKKEKKHEDKKHKQSFYQYTIVYRLLCAVGSVFNKLFQWINSSCRTSLIIKSIDSLMNDIKFKKLRVFNQFMVSFIVGYIIANVAFNMFASYKIKYVVVFACLTIGVNIIIYLVDKYKESSVLMWIIQKVMD